MGKSSLTFGKFSKFSTCAERCAGFIRARHPFKPAEAVENATGGAVSAAQVRKWLTGTSAPSLPAMCAMIATYGPDFLAAAMASPPDWLSSAARAERLAGIDAEKTRLTAEIASLRGDACAE